MLDAPLCSDQLPGSVGLPVRRHATVALTPARCQDGMRDDEALRAPCGGPLAATVGIPVLTASAAVLQWRGAFLVLSGLALTTALILWRMLCRDAAPGSGQVRLQSILAAYRPLVRHRASLTLIVAACLEHAGVWTMWTYYGSRSISWRRPLRHRRRLSKARRR